MNKKCKEILRELESKNKIKVWWDFEFPPKQELKLRLKDILEDEVDEKYYLKEEQIARIKNSTFVTEQRRIQEKDYCDTLCARDWKDPKCVRIGGIFDTENSIHQAGSIYDKEGIAPTLSTMEGGWRQPSVIESDKCILAGNLSGGKWDNILESSKRVYDENGISPTIPTCQGGNTQPKIIKYDVPQNEKLRKDIKTEEKYCEYCEKKLDRKRFNGRLEDFTVFKNRKYCDRECMKRDYLKIGDNHNQSYSNAHTTARKINELILHKEACELCSSDTNLDIHHIDGNWQNNNLDNLMCLCRSCHTRYERNKDKTELRIRKLTPREVWRLMGFTDDEFDKAAQVNSNSQLYKQARKFYCC